MGGIELPAEWVRRAFVSTSGELAWTRADAISAAGVLAERGLGLLGGEVWFLHHEGTAWWGLIPPAAGDVPFVYGWSISWDRPRESWEAFCRRGAEETVAAIGRFDEAWVRPDLRPQIRYNLTFVSLKEYEQLGR